ncbi:MAG: uroporphyrinogen decarboxylase family protein [Anaerolineales bacterium]|jgi:uroporphyrinogen decarboxylase
MNSAERIFAALRGQTPDRVPALEWFVHPKIIEALFPGASWPDFVENIGLDAMSALFLYEGTFKEVPIGPKKLLSEWGVTLGITDEHSAPIDGPIKTLDDAKHYLPPDPQASYRLGNLPAYVQRFKRQKAVIWCQRAEFMWAADLMRIDNLLISFIENKRLAHEVLDIVNEFAIALARRAVRAGADVIMLGDDYAYNSGPMMSPGIFKEFIQPRLAKVVQAVKEEGAFCIKHSDGNLWPLLDMIVETGVDAINPIEPVAGMDIAEVKRKYGSRVCLVGNIDCGDLLSNGTQEDVTRSVKETLLKGAPGGGYIMSSSNTIHSSVNPENYLAMITATHKYGQYPLEIGS